MSALKYKFKEINLINPVVKTIKDYQEINPLGNIPMIEDGHFRAIGGDVVIYMFISKNRPLLGQKVMPTDLEFKVKAILGWHQAKMYWPGQ